MEEKKQETPGTHITVIDIMRCAFLIGGGAALLGLMIMTRNGKRPPDAGHD